MGNAISLCTIINDYILHNGKEFELELSKFREGFRTIWFGNYGEDSGTSLNEWLECYAKIHVKECYFLCLSSEELPLTYGNGSGTFAVALVTDDGTSICEVNGWDEVNARTIKNYSDYYFSLDKKTDTKHIKSDLLNRYQDLLPKMMNDPNMLDLNYQDGIKNMFNNAIEALDGKIDSHLVIYNNDHYNNESLNILRSMRCIEIVTRMGTIPDITSVSEYHDLIDVIHYYYQVIINSIWER